jgi:hypothetical protein
MIPAFFAAVVLAASVSAGLPATLPFGQRVPLPDDTTVALDDFGRRVHAYMQLRDEIAAGAVPFTVTPDIGEIQRAVDKLALGIRVSRASAQQGEIFTPAIAAAFRRIVRAACHDRYTDLLAVNEDWEAPLPPAAVHGRWAGGVPLPTMPPDLLARLPRLPPGLEYRFVNHDLVLRDIDFVPEVIPVSSWTSTSR